MKPLFQYYKCGTSLLSLSCTDTDSGPNGDCSISILTGDDMTQPKFEISGTKLKTSANTIDYETMTHTTYSLVVIGKDNPSTGSPKTGTAYVFITIEGENEFNPNFASNMDISISEDIALGSTIVKYTATDKDTGTDGDLKYNIKSVTNSGADVFKVQTETGNILLSKPLDYEKVNKYVIVVVSTDGGGKTIYNRY
ncbi:hypothetical protein KUTeg_020915 [Tegillarca granosa]|uniref:Cadherin domain-containing protein n=1 Tax=Tegillarca granosa TaxID=220873 RepID=A0ABQ9E9A7_TEGGR|nr:hypothetical protein KUTeg_020915 [Tegillarca granosa]